MALFQMSVRSSDWVSHLSCRLVLHVRGELETRMLSDLSPSLSAPLFLYIIIFANQLSLLLVHMAKHGPPAAPEFMLGF